MLPASQALIDYLNSNIRDHGQYMRVVLTTPAGTIYTISDEDLVKGSFQITRSAVSGNALSIGECYINDVIFTVLDKQNRFNGNLDNSRVELYFGVANPSLGIDEEIKLGTFQIPVDSTIRKISTIQFSADSLLGRLDLPLNNEVFSGRPFNLLQFCCTRCNLTLGQSQSEIEALSDNANYTYYIDADSALTTYRDVVMYISQVLGGFATDDPDGNLVIRTYSLDNDAYTLDEDLVETSNYGDASYYLDGMSYVYNGETKYAHGSASSEYCLSLDDNPLLNNLEELVVGRIMDNIWSQLEGISFRSFDFTYNGNPLVELGDRLTYYSTPRQQQVTSFVTINKWKYHAKSTVTGSFLDKRTNVTDQSVKKAATTGGGGEGDSSTLGVVHYTDVTDRHLSTIDETIASFFITLPKKARPLVFLTSVVNVLSSGILEISSLYDNVTAPLKPKYSLPQGYHTISYTKSFDPADYDGIHSINFTAKFLNSGSGEILAGDTEVNALAWKATGGDGDWTGIFNLDDHVQPIIVDGHIVINPITDTSSASQSPET